jgi:hypothetical protein
MIDGIANHPLRGTAKIDSANVPYLDLRTESPEIGQAKLDQFLQEADSSATASQLTPGLGALLITTPQSSDAFALALARRGIQLIAAPAEVPISTLIDRFREQLRQIGTAGSFICATTVSAGRPDTPQSQRPPRSESPYAQYPPWFDQAAFDQRMRELQQPWRDEDGWKSES